MSGVENIEIAHLELRYEHSRIRQVRTVARMAESMAQFGQLVPVLVMQASTPVLIDGYLRVKALTRLKLDLVAAHLWPGSESDALIHVLAGQQGRSWELFEQAAILQELHLGHRLSRSTIARLLAKDKSWVVRRLQLFDTLDDETIALIRAGVISAWSAQRVLVPVARANPEHAKMIAAGLKKQSLSTRQLGLFFEYYKRSNRKARQHMASDPHLFLKTLEARANDQAAKTLEQGPAGLWLKDMRVVKHILARLVKGAPQVLYRGQLRLERRRFLTAYADAAEQMQVLSQAIERSADDRQSTTPDDFNPAPGRLPDSGNPPAGEGLAQHGASGHQGYSA
jgi:ParB-like chromosome segregation protein Spo0J